MWFHKVMVCASGFVDCDLEAGRSEVAAFVSDLQSDPPGPISESRNIDLGGWGLALDGEALPGVVGGRSIKSLEPCIHPTSEGHIEVGCGTCTDAHAQLHRCAAFDNEHVSAVIVADGVQHRAHHTDPQRCSTRCGTCPISLAWRCSKRWNCFAPAGHHLPQLDRRHRRHKGGGDIAAVLDSHVHHSAPVLPGHVETVPKSTIFARQGGRSSLAHAASRIRR